MDIDKVDYKLLEALVSNSRASLKQLGKHAGLSRENTAYHLQKLVEKGIIKNFTGIINPYLLGFKQHALFLQLIKLDKKKESQILEFLKNHPNVSWIGLLAGKWTLVLDIYSKNELELSKHLVEILSLFGDYVHDYALLPLQDKNYYAHKIFGSDMPKFGKINMKEMKLDKMDYKILEILNRNARATYAELTKEVDLTANAIKSRIDVLKTNGYILGYTIDVDPRVLGFQWYGVQLKIIKFDVRSIMKIKNFLAKQKDVLFDYQYISGFWDFDVGILVKQPEGLHNFLTELRNELPEIVKINDFFLLFEEVSDHALPRAFFMN